MQKTFSLSIKKILTYIFIFFTMLIILEGLFQVKFFIYKHHEEGWYNKTLLYDPNFDLYSLDPSHNKHLGVNKLGFRSPLINSKEKLPIIAFLGGSTTFDVTVPIMQDTWPFKAITILNNKRSKKFTYINAALPGYTVRNSHARFIRDVQKTKPSIVIIMHGYNDLIKQVQTIAYEQKLRNNPKIARTILSFSATYRYVRLNLNHLEAKKNRRKQNFITYDKKSFANNYKSQLDSLITDLKDHNIIPILLTIAPKYRDTDIKIDDESKKFLSLHPYLSYKQFLELTKIMQRATKDAALKHNIMVLDIMPSITNSKANYYDYVHFTNLGAKKFGEKVGNELDKILEK